MLEDPSQSISSESRVGHLNERVYNHAPARIVDIRDAVDDDKDSVREDILKGLRSDPPSLPTYVLYDSRGLQIYDKITKAEEYYLTSCEISILQSHALDIAASFPNGATVLELGCGSLIKTRLLLNALERLGKRTKYCALDLSASELRKALGSIDNDFKHVQIMGLHGTYDDGRRWLAKMRSNDSIGPVVILWLGSSIGNLRRPDAAKFLKQFISESLRTGDMFVIGIDRRNDPHAVWKAYNDSKGVTRSFIMNGLEHANRHLSKQIFKSRDWDYEGVYHADKGYHEAFYRAIHTADLRDIVGNETGLFCPGARIKVEESWKYSPEESRALFDDSGLTRVGQWTDPSELYDVHVLSVDRSMVSNGRGQMSVPTLKEWRELWRTWDLVSERMMPETMLFQQPIAIRNECLFYRGHIPTFLDMKLTEAIPELPAVEPSYFKEIFGRGIDPDVDDPSSVHTHSEKPSSWPPAAQIARYKEDVRAKLSEVYLGHVVLSKLGWRSVWMGFEHEAMHIETLLYMLMQSNLTKRPAATPSFSSAWPIHNSSDTIEIEMQDVILGMFDSEKDDDEIAIAEDLQFGWDNEKPPTKEELSGKLEVSSCLITNGQYLEFLRAASGTEVPASWSGDKLRPCVKTVFGPIGFDASDHDGPAMWPVLASYRELERYALWRGEGWRLPTEAELRIIYDFSTGGSFESNSYDVADSNVGFKFYHPTPLDAKQRVAGPGSMGAWEWTSTVLSRKAGFCPSRLYPEYTADFFDGKHNVVLGGSWATQPRQASRRSFRNWYHRGYKFAFTGGRLVRMTE